MNEPFDLARLAIPDKPEPWQPQHHTIPVDISGKPWPKGVAVKLNSGVVVKCDVRFQGTAPNARLFTVIAEIDWENYHPTVLMVEEMPSDVEFRFRVPGLPDGEATDKFVSQLQLQPQKIVRV